jgi:hypothetical protein
VLAQGLLSLAKGLKLRELAAPIRSAFGLPQHADEYRREGPVLLAVDQKLGEGATLRVAPELADPVGSLEVGEHEDVEQLGARSRPEGLKALREATLKVIRSIGKSLRRREASPGPMYGSSDGCDG